MALRQIFRRTFRALDHRIYQRIMRTERIILKLRLKAKDVRRERDLLTMIHILEGRIMVPKGGVEPPWYQVPRDFESRASASSATSA
jgi:hypothetical protein